MRTNEISLYFHIPFCVRKCLYCDFLSFSASESAKDDYLRALQKEAKEAEKLLSGRVLRSVFVGGGTPSSLSKKQLSFLFDIIGGTVSGMNISQDCEYTVECNPGTADKEKLKVMRNAGVNRLSFGLQSADEKELRALGRIHTFEDFLESLSLAKEEGFLNINADLMSSIPYQTTESYSKTLKTVAGLGLSHISAYSLIVEPGTEFFNKYTPGEYPLCSEDDEREMYYLTKSILGEYGYSRYEISNYAKEGKESIHNTGYWTGREYLGLGLGASSYINGTRFKNTSVTEKYLASPADCREDAEILSKEDMMAEFMFLGLRMMKGVSEAEFENRFFRKVDDVYGEIISKQQKRGLIVRDGKRIFLTERGIDISNIVMSEYLPD